jgi:hypothetical protein
MLPAIVPVALLLAGPPVVGGLSGGGSLHAAGRAECISPAERRGAEVSIARFLASRPAEVRTVAEAKPAYPFFPQAGSLDRDLLINNYVDLDPSAGIRDWSCHTNTYDGHAGIDSDIRSFGEQQVGVPVFAALDGTVVVTHDGESDMNTVAAGQPANYVIVDHGAGRQAWYWHLKKGSVAVAPGQPVVAGEQIGLTASSGNSTGPHLHLETQDDGAVLEPFAGACRPGGSAWEAQNPFNGGVYAYDFGFSAQSLSSWTPPFEPPRTGQIGLGDPSVYFWMLLANLPANSAWRVRFTRPDGTIAYQSDATPFDPSGNPAYRSSYWWWSYDIPDLHAITGTWTVSLFVNDALLTRGVVVDRAPLEVRPARTVGFNRPPEPVAAVLDPPAPGPNDAVFCRVRTSRVLDDRDYDLVRYRYLWTVNGSPVRQVTTAAQSDAIPKGSVPAGAAVACTVTPNDGTVDGPSAVATSATASAPLRLYTLSPCRLLDTRVQDSDDACFPGLLASSGCLAFTLDRCGVPPTARALSLNVTVAGGSDAPGDLRVVPGGRPLPFASTINYGQGQVRANNAVVELGALGDLQVWCDQQAGGGVQFILDVNGYFE